MRQVEALSPPVATITPVSTHLRAQPGTHVWMTSLTPPPNIKRQPSTCTALHRTWGCAVTKTLVSVSRGPTTEAPRKCGAGRKKFSKGGGRWRHFGYHHWKGGALLIPTWRVQPGMLLKCLQSSHGPLPYAHTSRNFPAQNVSVSSFRTVGAGKGWRKAPSFRTVPTSPRSCGIGSARRGRSAPHPRSTHSAPGASSAPASWPRPGNQGPGTTATCISTRSQDQRHRNELLETGPAGPARASRRGATAPA